jgi:DNA-binding NtrC family response regulator
LDASARELMMEYHWPGNVRELENIVTRASVLHAGRPVTADELRRWLIVPEVAPRQSGGHGRGAVPAREGVPVGISLEEMERRLIEATLEHFRGHRAKTAKALGIGLRTLSGKLRQYGYAPREKSFVINAAESADCDEQNPPLGCGPARSRPVPSAARGYD